MMGVRHVSSFGRAPHLTVGVAGSSPAYDTSLQRLDSEAERLEIRLQDLNAQPATLNAAFKAITMLTAAEMQTGLPFLSAGSRADGCYSEGSPVRSTSRPTSLGFTHGTTSERMEQLRQRYLAGKRK